MRVLISLVGLFCAYDQVSQSQSNHQITGDSRFGKFLRKDKKERGRKQACDQVYYLMIFYLNSFIFLSYFCHRRRTGESKQKNNISINNWTFRYAFFGFLCFKNAKTQQEIFCAWIWLHAFQVANSVEKRRARFCTFGEMIANPFNLHFRAQQNFAQLMLFWCVWKSNWNCALCNDCFVSFFFLPIEYRCVYSVHTKCT